MDVGRRVVELREQKNISTNKLANLAGISQSYLREVEMGNKNPTVEILSYICDAINISLQEFFAESTNPTSPFLLSAVQKLSEEEQTKLADFINTIKNK